MWNEASGGQQRNLSNRGKDGIATRTIDISLFSSSGFVIVSDASNLILEFQCYFCGQRKIFAANKPVSDESNWSMRLLRFKMICSIILIYSKLRRNLFSRVNSTFARNQRTCLICIKNNTKKWFIKTFHLGLKIVFKIQHNCEKLCVNLILCRKRRIIKVEIFFALIFFRNLAVLYRFILSESTDPSVTNYNAITNTQDAYESFQLYYNYERRGCTWIASSVIRLHYRCTR